MIIDCKHCSKKVPVPDACFKHGPITVTCPYCSQKFRPNAGTNKKSTIPPVIEEDKSDAWLIVHDENAPLQTFNIEIGNQLIGRKSISRQCDIMIQTQDMYMSRNHFSIEARKVNNTVKYILMDNNATNFTFINSVNTGALAKVKKSDKFILKDGDMIQAGETKIVFKLKSNKVTNAAEATKMVIAQPKGRTVLISSLQNKASK